MSSLITVVQIDKDTTRFEDSNIVRAIKLKDVDSFIIDTSVIGDGDEEVFYKEGFVRTSTFCRDDGIRVTREYAVYDRRKKL